MVSIINGARILPPKPDLNIPNTDPNTRLKVINNSRMITEEEKTEEAANKKIAAFRPDKMRGLLDKQRLEHIKGKQRKGDIREVLDIVQKKIDSIKKHALKGTRFAKEVGKGSIHDITA